MKVAVVGKGNVGKAVAPALARAGHDVAYGVRDPEDEKYRDGDGVDLRTVGEAATWAEVVILAVSWGQVDAVLDACGAIAGKVLVDCTNPYDVEDDLRPLVQPHQSAAELIQARTSAKVVKALNQVGAPVIAKARSYKVPPVQFAASDDRAAKETVMTLLRDIGFEPRDAGPLSRARELEGMARLWMAQTFGQGMSTEAAWMLRDA